MKKTIRANFRTAVFSRDGHRCRVCGKNDQKLDAHHITDRHDMPNGGYVKENGVSLCEECHLKAELAKPNDQRYGAEALYCLIGSNYQNAVEVSEKLEVDNGS